MKGMDSMFKMMGLDPKELEKITSNVNNFLKHTSGRIEELNGRLSRIESKLDLILLAEGIEWKEQEKTPPVQ